MKPFLFTDGYVYACPSAELSIENNYNYVPESQFAVCDIDGIEDFTIKANFETSCLPLLQVCYAK